jgi:uncharacterized protein YkwD
MLRRLLQSRVFTILLILVGILYAPEIRTFTKKIILGNVKQLTVETPAVVDLEIPSSEHIATVTQQGFTQTYRGPLSVNEIIDATNKERTKAGLTPLKTNTLLIQSAKKKVDDMIALNYFEHTSPSGKTVSDLADSVEYKYIILGENLAVGDFLKTPELLDAWMKSKGHRENIMNPQYQEMGAYAARGVYEGRKVWFAVQHFGTNQGVCPSINTNLKHNIDTVNKDLKEREVTIEHERVALEDTAAILAANYKERVASFNTMVAEYNTLLAQVKAKIVVYNEEVRVFNTCIAVFQKSNSKKEVPAAAKP